MPEDQSAGATPVVPGATPGQTDSSTAQTPAPAAGDPQMATDEGKRALDQLRSELKAERSASKAALAELESLRTSQLTEHEKAIAQARREAAAEARTRADALVRRSEVRRALASAGIVPDSLDLAAMAGEFSGLAVDDEGQVAELERAVADFRKARPALFAQPRPAGGNFDGGPGGAGGAQPVFTGESLGAMSQREYEAKEADIMRAYREGRVRR